MKKKISAGIFAGSLVIIFILFLISSNTVEKATDEPSPQQIKKGKIVNSPTSTSRKITTRDATGKKKQSPSFSENGITKEIFREINRNTSKKIIILNGENYKIVKGLFASKGEDDKRPLFRLFGHSFYKGDTANGPGRDQYRVVVNSNTDTLGILTGKITLTLSSPSSIEDLRNRYDLTVEYSNDKIGIAVVSSSRPIQSVYRALSNDIDVTEAELEIIESQHQSK
ncbi:MAG: hypothetical protein KAG61_12825 [Bacteriovoracaceae bacterium]|nr:hypothetical protein [Bacteriovoracaceae bacterium]